MKIVRIMIYVDHGRRILINPQGGMDLEALVQFEGGPQWVLDNEADVSDELLADTIRQASRMVFDSQRGMD